MGAGLGLLLPPGSFSAPAVPEASSAALAEKLFFAHCRENAASTSGSGRYGMRDVQESREQLSGMLHGRAQWSSADQGAWREMTAWLRRIALGQVRNGAGGSIEAREAAVNSLTDIAGHFAFAM